jgi:hypothetical protein
LCLRCFFLKGVGSLPARVGTKWYGCVKCTIHAHVLVAHVHGAYNAATYLGVHVKMVLGPVVHDKHSTGPGRRRLVAVRESGHLREGITC